MSRPDTAVAFRPLRSKLRPARAHLELVRRDDLVDSLLHCTTPVVLVSAPAGYGKSTVLAQWAANDHRPTAWLHLDSADDDPVVLLSYLAAALGEVAPVDPGVADLLSQRHPPVEEQVLPEIAAALADAQPFLLVLDDGHLLHSDACWRHIDFVLHELPGGSQVAIGTREDPPLPLARLRAAGRLAEFRNESLAMSRREARELLSLHGSTCDDATLDALLLVTEGWPTGLYLAVLAGKGHDTGGWLPHVHGDLHEIAAYLGAEVLDRQPADVQRFLTRTSLLDELSAPLCTAVVEGGDAGEVLARLARENLFVAALDDRDEWYRYHHLFRELLGAQLERREPERLVDLNRRAAVWYHEHDRVDLAVRHWLAANDAAAAAEPAFEACWEYVDRGQVETARLMFDRFTDQQIESHLPLTMAAGWLYGTVLDDRARGERWRRAACAARTDDGLLPGGGGTWRTLQLGLRAFLAPNGLQAMLDDAELACTLSGELPMAARAESKRVLGVATYLNGRYARARRLFDDVVNEAEDPPTKAYAAAFLSLIAGDEGRWDDAAELDARAAELSPSMTLDISPGMFLALPMLLARTRVLAQRGDPQWPEWRSRTEKYLADMVPQVEWRILLLSVVLGEAALQHDDLAEAERWAARAESVLRSQPDSGMLRGRTQRLRQALEQRRMSDPLTAAERRVLELLPTQLTAGQMAARLFVSRNTVKTHMRRLYLKLEVTTRTAAVERARELRLLPPTGDR